MSVDPPCWDDAVCRSLETALFFSDDLEDQAQAAAACALCPLLESCREYAIHHEPHGVWGALTARQRKRIRKQRGIELEAVRARPVAVCGTTGGYQRHRRNDDKPCSACREANSAASLLRKRVRQERAAS